MAMHGRYQIVIWVNTMARWNLAGLAAKPGRIRYISHGMARVKTTARARVIAASSAMASAARTSATSSPSCSSDLE